MNSQLDEFSKRASALLSEPGILEKRPSWQAVKAGAISLAAFADAAATQLLPEISIVFILASSATGSKRDSLLKAFFQRALQQMPSDDLIKLLSKCSQAELKDNLLPYVYETGTRGAVACFVAARLRINLAAEAFQYFLSARTWSQIDLMNLSLLVKPEDSAALCSHLEKIIPTIDAKLTRDNVTEFRYVLFNHLAVEPMLPEIVTTESPAAAKQPSPPPATLSPQSQKPAQTFSPAEKIVASPSVSPQKQPTKPVSITAKLEAANAEANVSSAKAAAAFAANDDTSQRQISPSPTNLDVSMTLPDNLRKLILPVSIIILCLSAGILYSTWYYSEPMLVQATSAARSNKAPQQWVDAVSQRPVTAKYLNADKDFRMGELFLTRDMYAEALKLFEDALAIDPEHIQATVRAGFCRMKTGDNKKAAEIFRKVLARQPDFESVNLYLARICLAGNDLEAAEKHFRAEFLLQGDLTVGMEFANFLARRGKQNEAMEMIAALQDKFPGKMLVLAPDATPESGKQQSGGEAQ